MRVTLDSETHLISDAQPVPPPVCVSYAYKGDAGILHAKDPQLKKTLRKALDQELNFANAPFDLCVFGEAHDELVEPAFTALDEGRVWDVLTAEKMWDIAHAQYGRFSGKMAGYNLAAVALRRLGVVLEKGGWQLRYAELEDVELSQWPAEAIEYPKNDALSTAAIELDQQERRAAFAADNDGIDVFQDLHREVQAKMALHLMSVWGICVDQAKVDAFDAQITREWEEARDRLMKIGLVRKDGTRDTKAAQARMEAAGGTKLTDGGAPSLDAEACADSGDPVLVDYAAFGSLLKLKSTYIKPMRDAGNLPIHAYFEELRETGRTSCSRPNLQNLPRKPGIRECYTARPGCVFIACDYGKAELVALAQVCIEKFGYSRLGEALTEGRDPHDEVAMLIGGMEHRTSAKNANFAFGGGAGVDRFIGMTKQSTGIVMEHEYAATVREGFFSAWPEVGEYHRWVGDLCDTDDGRAYVRDALSGFCRGGCSFTEAANFHFQTRVASCAKDAGWRLAKRQYTQRDSALFETHSVVFVHDEWILEVPEDRAQACCSELSEVMLEAARFWMPRVRMSADAKVMGKHWTKG